MLQATITVNAPELAGALTALAAALQGANPTPAPALVAPAVPATQYALPQTAAPVAPIITPAANPAPVRPLPRPYPLRPRPPFPVSRL
jgi:hypothetical protein